MRPEFRGMSSINCPFFSRRRKGPLDDMENQERVIHLRNLIFARVGVFVSSAKETWGSSSRRRPPDARHAAISLRSRLFREIGFFQVLRKIRIFFVEKNFFKKDFFWKKCFLLILFFFKFIHLQNSKNIKL